MDSTSSRTPPSAPAYVPAAAPLLKLVVAGGTGVGKTTLVSTVSEMSSLHTEQTMTSASVPVDSLEFTPDKTTTTVAIDFGRLTLNPDNPAAPVLYLFGTPGQSRFKGVWDQITYGARGAVLLLDLRRPEESFEAMDLLERSAIPYIVAVNDFPGAPYVSDTTVRTALDLTAMTPLIHCDARNRNSVIDALIRLVQHVMAAYHQDTAR